MTAAPAIQLQRTATIRGRHRLLLTRRWDATPDAPIATWIMLNPSRADHQHDDPTIRRCINFSRAVGCGGLQVLNLFTLITPSPRDLFAHPRPNHAEADRTLHTILAAAATTPIICAWGAHAHHPRTAPRITLIHDLATRHNLQLQCLATTKAGHPRHPLYLGAHLRPRNLPPVPEVLSC